MNICILGGDGYLGWPTAIYFAARGHAVLIIDNMVKRAWEEEVGGGPLMAIPRLSERIRIWNRVAVAQRLRTIDARTIDISANYADLLAAFATFKPDTIVHYAEQPSGPYSMAAQDTAVETQRNNVLGTLNVMFAMHEACPDAHLVKLGTLGEYGTPNIDIEEGWIEIEHNGRKDRMLYPKRPGSFYHLSKVHDSANLEFGCRIWNMRVTDLNQGVVYGITTDETVLAPGLHTSFHYDAVFGTVINRFIVQAICGVPLTLYGKGQQKRGTINIRDTLRCVELAAVTPAKPGEFRVFNQNTEQFALVDLAELVARCARAKGYAAEISHVRNPRTEMEEHYYNVKHQALERLGLEPHLLTEQVIGEMIDVAVQHKANIVRDSILPDISWQSGKEAAARQAARRVG
jgi:UDP-sulfoquinovose synthase